MDIIVKGRKGGKTHRCIEVANKTDSCIVCPTKKDARRIIDKARRMGVVEDSDA